MNRDIIHTLRKLPHCCYGLQNGEPVVIQRGGIRAVPASISADMVDLHNAQMNVTRHQRQAMENGLVFGWNTNSADPDHLAKQVGDPPHEPSEFKVVLRLAATLTFSAFSEAEALEQANEITVPEGWEMDAPPYIA